MKEFFIPSKKNSYKPYLLRKGLLVFYTIILVVVNTFGGFFGISKIAASNITPTNIISLTNQERSANGLNTLSQNSKLATAAMAKAENMFEEQYWDHFGPNGETPWQFITGAGYNYVYAGENLAKGFRTSEGVVEAWMASPTHRDNLLSKNYKDIGVAIKTGVLLGKETTLVVQMFGNLTSEVQGSTSNPVTQTPVTKSPVIETGQIKAISITHPKTGDILKDPSLLVKGAVEGDKDEYTVELFDLEEKVIEIKGEGDDWQYSSEENWKEGDHELEARVKGTNIVSDTTTFTVDTTPPTIVRDSITVVRDEDSFTLNFNTDEQWYEIKVVSGEQEEVFLKAETDQIQLENFNSDEKVVLYVSDQAGNTTELDITEYFIEGETEEYNNFNFSLLFNSIKSTEGINIIVVIFILILMSIEIYYLWKKGKLARGIGDIFVIALWITILTIGIFKGFGGVAL
jgi:hypothetical protein